MNIDPSKVPLSIGGLKTHLSEMRVVTSKFCVWGLLQDETEDYPFGKQGSATKLRYNENYFLALCDHQFDCEGYIADPSDFVLPLENSGYEETISCNGVIKPPTDLGWDLVVLDFSKAVSSGALSENGWFDLSANENCFGDTDVDVEAIGFRGETNSIDFERRALSQSLTHVGGKTIPSALQNRCSFSLGILPKELNPKGMSGGPVFEYTNLGPTALGRLGGITTNASHQTFNYLPTELILRTIVG